MDRIYSLEAVRGMLALWVVVGHTILHSGYSSNNIGPFKLLAVPALAVDVFIILSGFVIFFLLDNQRTSYGQFLVKRWFRLAPLLMAVMLVSALTLNVQLGVIDASPFPSHAVTEDAKLHLDSISYLPQHLLAHATMLHGMVPNSWLPSSQFAIVGQAWSISLEWQFYLIAPLVFGLIAARRYGWLCAVIVAVCALRSLNFENDGFIIRQAQFFIIGILSYYGWKFSRAITIAPGAVDALALSAIALVYLLLTRTASLIIWIAVMAVIVAERRNAFSKAQKLASTVLQWPVMQWLGKISYSIYLVHMLVFYAVQYAVMALYPTIAKPAFLAVMLVGVVGGTIALSMFSYRFVEMPGIQAGRRVGAWFGAQGAPRFS